MSTSHPKEPDFIDRMHQGSRSTRSIDIELESADTQMATTDGVRSYYGLEPTVGDNLIPTVMSGDVNPQFLKMFMFMLHTVNPALPALFSTGKGTDVMKLLSTAYTERRLNLADLQHLVDDPNARVLLARIDNQYIHGGIAAVSTEDILAVVQTIDFSSFKKMGSVLGALLTQVIYHRTLTLDMIKVALVKAHATDEEDQQTKSAAASKSEVETDVISEAEGTDSDEDFSVMDADVHEANDEARMTGVPLKAPIPSITQPTTKLGLETPLPLSTSVAAVAEIVHPPISKTANISIQTPLPLSTASAAVDLEPEPTINLTSTTAGIADYIDRSVSTPRPRFHQPTNAFR